jgi:hypothetical protein
VTTSAEAFAEGWRLALRARTPAVRVTSALFKLTKAGDWPNTIEILDLASAAGMSREGGSALAGCPSAARRLA